MVVPRWCDYYCAMHFWCIVSWPWVQYIFGVASLGYALSATLRRLATAVAHLLYFIRLFLGKRREERKREKGGGMGGSI